MIITSLNGVSETLTDYQIRERSMEVNGDYSLPFFVVKTERNEHSFDLVQEESIVEYDGQTYRIKSIQEYVTGKTVVKEIQSCPHTFFDIVDDYQYETLTGTLNIVQALNHTFGVTDWTYVNQGAFASVQFDNFGDDNALSLFQTILERYGAEFEITGDKQITLKNQIGTLKEVQFRYGHNIKTFSKNVDTNNLSTYIRGYGKDGITAEYTSPNASVYGIKHAPVVRDERFTSQSTLLDHLKKVIEDEPLISLELEVVELEKQGITQYVIGDSIYLIYEPLNLDVIVRIMKFTDYPESKKSPRVVLSNIIKKATDKIVSFEHVRKSVKQLTDADGNLSLKLKKLYRNSNHYSDQTGDWYISEDDPNAYVHIGAGGLDVHRGLIRVEREDGYASIQSGYLSVDYTVQPTYPPYREAGVIQEDYWLSSVSSSYKNLGYFNFKHEARYLKIVIYTRVNNPSNLAAIRVEDANNLGTYLAYAGTTSTELGGQQEVITLDFGVPTGTRKSFLFQMRSTIEGEKSYARILQMYLEG